MYNPATDIVTDGITCGIEERQQRGLAIAARCKLKKNADVWVVPSQSEASPYRVQVGQTPHCTCPDHEIRGCKCKHIYAVEYTIEREINADGTTTVTETITATKRATYPQNWPAYNKAQQNEKSEFQRLLHNLCADLEVSAPAGKKKGRPRMPVSDAVFCAVFKVFSTYSSRRFTSDMCDAQGKGYIGKVPHFNSVLNYLENEELTPILLKLIERSSLLLKAVECDFAADSTGFTSSRFVRWFDHKYGVVKQHHDWCKLHILTGVKTNIVAAVEIHDRDASDTKQLPPMLATAAANGFTMREVSADKGYSSIRNHDLIESYGATPFIAFKSNATGTDRAPGAGAWVKMFHYFSFRRDEFLAHYHKRSNVESTVMMIKTKFGDGVRSRTTTSMKNVVLCKVLCHNICCVIQSMFELGVQPEFDSSNQSQVSQRPTTAA